MRFTTGDIRNFLIAHWTWHMISNINEVNPVFFFIQRELLFFIQRAVNFQRAANLLKVCLNREIRSGIDK